MEEISRGAEAVLLREGKTLIKRRTPKGYRSKCLDLKIRKERTKMESNLMRKAKTLGIKTPKIISTDLQKMEIEMEYIEGQRLKNVLCTENINFCLDAGKSIGIMHSNGLVHGDLTTSNIIEESGTLHFIDFGLGFHSNKTEDFAVDLLNFKRTFKATHSELMEGWELILSGYSENFPRASEVIARMEEVEKRARYH